MKNLPLTLFLLVILLLPIVYGGVAFVNPTPINNSNQIETEVIINASIINKESLQEFYFNWNGDNMTFYSSSVILLYNFENNSALGESDNKITDNSLYSNNGTIQGGLTGGIVGKYGNAFNFDGSDDYILISNSTTLNTLNTSFTVSAWIKRNSINSWQTIYSSGTQANEWRLGFSDVNDLTFSESGIADNKGDKITDTSSYHYVSVVKNSDIGTNLFLYIDGINTDNFSVGSVETPSGNKFIGSEDGVTGFFNGIIDDLIIFNVSFTSSEIYNFYLSTLQKYDTDKWYFLQNRSNLSLGVYEFQAYIDDDNSGSNFVTISNGSVVSFVNPTPINGYRDRINISINLSCSSLPAFFNLWFDNVTPPLSKVMDNNSLSLFNTSISNDNLYYYTASCVFGGLESPNSSIRSYELDTASPIAIGIQNIIIANNTNVNFSINFTDDHFFSFNITCSNLPYTDSVTGLDTTFYQANFTFFVNKSDTCTVHYSDGHTANKLRKTWDIRKNQRSLEFRTDNRHKRILTVNHNETVIFRTAKLKDRITFNISFIERTRTNAINIYDFTYETVGRGYYIPSKEFPAWIVDPVTNTWLDMKCQDSTVQVFQVDKNHFDIRIKSRLNYLACESTGELNTVVETFTISLPASAQPFKTLLGDFKSCPLDGTFSNDSIIITIFVSLILLWLFSMTHIKIPIISMMIGGVFLFLSLTIWNCGLLAGVTLSVVGLAMVLKELFD